MKFLSKHMVQFAILFFSLAAILICVLSMFGYLDQDRKPASARARLGKKDYLDGQDVSCANDAAQKVALISASTPVCGKDGELSLLTDKAGNLTGMLVSGKASPKPRRVCAPDINSLKKLVLVSNGFLGDLIFLQATAHFDQVKNGGKAQISYKVAGGSKIAPTNLEVRHDAASRWKIFVCDQNKHCNEELTKLDIDISMGGVAGFKVNGRPQ